MGVVPTDTYIADWRFLFLNPTKGLKLVDEMFETAEDSSGYHGGYLLRHELPAIDVPAASSIHSHAAHAVSLQSGKAGRPLALRPLLPPGVRAKGPGAGRQGEDEYHR